MMSMKCVRVNALGNVCDSTLKIYLIEINTFLKFVLVYLCEDQSTVGDFIALTRIQRNSTFTFSSQLLQFLILSSVQNYELPSIPNFCVNSAYIMLLPYHHQHLSSSLPLLYFNLII